METAISRPATLDRHGLRHLPERRIVRTDTAIPHMRPINAKDRTRAPLLGRFLCNRLPGRG
ncbi:MAG: hypothetical protein AAF683_15675 [Pseudomonadota bacterium]